MPERGQERRPNEEIVAQDSKKLSDVAQNLERERERSADGASASVKSTFKSAAPSAQGPGSLHGQSPHPDPTS